MNITSIRNGEGKITTTSCYTPSNRLRGYCHRNRCVEHTSYIKVEWISRNFTSVIDNQAPIPLSKFHGNTNRTVGYTNTILLFSSIYLTNGAKRITSRRYRIRHCNVVRACRGNIAKSICTAKCNAIPTYRFNRLTIDNHVATNFQRTVIKHNVLRHVSIYSHGHRKRFIRIVIELQLIVASFIHNQRIFAVFGNGCIRFFAVNCNLHAGHVNYVRAGNRTAYNIFFIQRPIRGKGCLRCQVRNICYTHYVFSVFFKERCECRVKVFRRCSRPTKVVFRAFNAICRKREEQFFAEEYLQGIAVTQYSVRTRDPTIYRAFVEILESFAVCRACNIHLNNIPVRNRYRKHKLAIRNRNAHICICFITQIAYIRRGYLIIIILIGCRVGHVQCISCTAYRVNAIKVIRFDQPTGTADVAIGANFIKVRCQFSRYRRIFRYSYVLFRCIVTSVEFKRICTRV